MFSSLNQKFYECEQFQQQCDAMHDNLQIQIQKIKLISEYNQKIKQICSEMNSNNSMSTEMNVSTKHKLEFNSHKHINSNKITQSNDKATSIHTKHTNYSPDTPDTPQRFTQTQLSINMSPLLLTSNNTNTKKENQHQDEKNYQNECKSDDDEKDVMDIFLFNNNEPCKKINRSKKRKI